MAAFWLAVEALTFWVSMVLIVLGLKVQLFLGGPEDS